MFRFEKMSYEHFSLGPKRVDVSAFQANKNVGCVSVLIFPTRTRQYAEIHDLLVKESTRGQGLERSLMKEAISICYENWYGSQVQSGCCMCLHIRLTSRSDRVVANNLYRSLGFKLISKATKEGTNLYEMIFRP